MGHSGASRLNNTRKESRSKVTNPEKEISAAIRSHEELKGRSALVNGKMLELPSLGKKFKRKDLPR